MWWNVCTCIKNLKRQSDSANNGKGAFSKQIQLYQSSSISQLNNQISPSKHKVHANRDNYQTTNNKIFIQYHVDWRLNGFHQGLVDHPGNSTIVLVIPPEQKYSASIQPGQICDPHNGRRDVLDPHPAALAHIIQLSPTGEGSITEPI